MYKAFKYYVSDHAAQGLLLHCEGCEHLPAIDSRAFIGSCYTSNQAMTVASAQYAIVKPCPLCVAKLTSVSTTGMDSQHPAVLCRPSKPKKRKVEKVLVAVRHFPI